MGLFIRPEYLLLETTLSDQFCRKVAWRARFPDPRQSLDGLVTIWSVMVDMADEEIQTVVKAGATPCSFNDIRSYLDKNIDQWERPIGVTKAPLTRPAMTPPVAPVALVVGLAPVQRWTIGDSSCDPFVLVALHGWQASLVLMIRRWSSAVKRVLLTPIL